MLIFWFVRETSDPVSVAVTEFRRGKGANPKVGGSGKEGGGVGEEEANLLNDTKMSEAKVSKQVSVD